MKNKRHLTTLPDGRMAIIHPTFEDDDPNAQARLDKVMFENSRQWLDSGDPTMTPEELDRWQRNIHFTDYTGPVLLPRREVTAADIPTDRYFRNAWTDTGAAVDIDIPKAREIHQKVIERQVDKEVTRLQWELLEEDNPGEQARLRGELASHRGMVAALDLGNIMTPSALKAAWPAGLPDPRT